MTIFPKGTLKKAGLAPGTLVHTAEKKTERTAVRALDYGRDALDEREVQDPAEWRALKDSPAMTWIRVEGIHETEVLRQLGEAFGIHALVLEDILHTEQRPKVEDYDDYLYVVLKVLLYDGEAKRISVEQLSIVLGKNFVITFEEKDRGLFEPILKRIREAKGRFRSRGVDYLFHTLVDVVVDHYFVILERLGEDVEELEEDVIEDPTPQVMHRIFDARVNMLILRRALYPLRDLTNLLVREDYALIGEEVEVYFRDVYDHAVQLIETVEVSRDMVQNMADLYISVVNNRLNEVIKMLTLIATIFIPLTFISSVYGMNFKYMPELEHPWGYFAIWGVMIGLGVSMLGYFKRRGWI
ncbi:MAG: magnesium/cobalt transporter CorA [Nitrospinota bacterium]